MDVTIKPVYNNEILKENLNKSIESENILKKENSSNDNRENSKSNVECNTQNIPVERKKHPQLKEEYTFERFV